MIGSMSITEAAQFAAAIAAITLPGAITVAAMERAVEAFQNRRDRRPRTTRNA